MTFDVDVDFPGEVGCMRCRFAYGKVQGRSVLVGDAAHPMTPNLGQGGCTALEVGARNAMIL